ncbi:unnamed protein product [Trichogramma brassicae]|uniref:RNA-directed DNA polymerase n=1 Tax=Trichogramma brassicae TaxID=86971 RepID=A0A6H5J312_9HYME|nr:unnamed protein product [Trichogramma brassicae]
MRISKHSRLVDICQLCYRSIEKLVESTWNVRRFCQSRWSGRVDFGRRWRVDISMGRNQWRSGDGPWHNFAKLNEARSMRCDIVAECAGITVCGGEREIIESKIKRLIPDVPPKLGHTDKIVHRIELVEGAKPVCHRTRRMTPKMEKIAHECLQKMKEEGIIEPAKSEWNSAPVLIVYRKGSLHYVPDALSRAFECDERSEFFAFERIEDEWYMKKLSEVKKSPSKYTNWYIEDGMLYKRSYNALLDPVSNAENSWRLVVPAEQRERVLTESHCLTSSGHLGAKKTYDRLACEYWWPGMWYAVEEYCNSCDVCQRYKVPQTGPKGLMTRRVVDRPWAVVAADMMEFPRSKNQNKWSATPTRSNGVRFAAVVRGATGRTAPSVRPAMDERAGASSSERNASEEARASQEAVAELNEYVRLMELGVPARLRPEPEGRAVVEVSGELIPVFARPSMHASEDAMDWEESVQPGNYSWQRPAWQQRTDADRRRASRQRRQASGVGTRQRTPSPGEGRRPNGGGEPLLEEETRAMLEQLVAARQPVEEWDGEAFEEVFRGSPEEEVLLLEEGEATATLRRSGETTEESARVPTPPLAPVQEPSALPLPPPVQQVSYVAGLHGLVFQPFAVQQQRLPQTEYPLDGQQQRQLRRPGPYQEQQQHRQLPRRQPQQHQREEVRVEVRPLSPVAGPSSLSGNTAAPARIRGENFGGLEPVGFVPGLDPPRGACFECHEPGHTRRQCRSRRTTATYIRRHVAHRSKIATLKHVTSRKGICKARQDGQVEPGYTHEPKITATGRGIPEGHPLPRRASPGQVHSGAREGGHPCPGRLQPGEGETPPRPASLAPHSARSSGDPPATQRLEGQEGEREVGSRESHEQLRRRSRRGSCAVDSSNTSAQIKRSLLSMTPQHKKKKYITRCRTALFKTPPPLDRPVERPTYNTIYQYINISKYQYINISIYQYINISIYQYIKISIY